ncbi:MAG: aminopeptidase P family protein [Muribaculaceae bacterium]|nr:aminopeptidase P family protein [Muribaculaceae bacterium]
MSTIYNERINALRAQMQKNEINAIIIPQLDPHQSEYIAEHWQARYWLSGFNGSAGTLVVTDKEALLWTDSRYFIQATDQLAPSGILLMKEGLPDTPTIAQYLNQNLAKGSTVGIDGMLFSINEASSLNETLCKQEITLTTDCNLINDIWTNRPPLPEGKIFIHEEKYAGESASSKIKKVLDSISKENADCILISALDEIAWVLNIRANDVTYNPVATAFLLLSNTGSTLFIDNTKLDIQTIEYLSANNIKTASYSEVLTHLTSLPSDIKVIVEKAKTAHAFLTVLGERIKFGSSPIAQLKGCKNPTQIQKTREAMLRDGVALVKSFIEIENKLQQGDTLTEIDIADILTSHRRQQPLYFDDSFDTIAGYNDHGAIVHYSATPETNYQIKPTGILLIDSGAQYLDGTTDITRTITLGEPTTQQKRDFTLVMKGHIALGSAIFPAGTRGAQLDALARQFLWKDGLTYLHGTGHGVGYFLNVHEGPQSIRLNENPTPLCAGMITSNEPGLYREGEYGIRCENLVLTVPAFKTEFGEFLKFETLTMFPFDLKLFDTSIMSDEEIAWINDYHTTVRERLSPMLNEEEKRWLEAKTAKLSR